MDRVESKEQQYRLLEALVEFVAKRVRSPDCTAADLNIAHGLLRLCGTTADRVNDSPLSRLAASLPDLETISSKHSRNHDHEGD